MKANLCPLLFAASALGAFLAAALPVDASTLTVPTSLATTDANASSNTYTIPLSRTSQSQIAASELSDMNIGDRITGISFRLDSGMTTSPGIHFSHLHITLAQAGNSMANFGTNVAANMTNPVEVFAPLDLALPAGYFPNSSPAGSPNPFSAPIAFTTPYVYVGGDLILLVSHTQSDANIYLDSASSATPGYGTLFRTSRENFPQFPTLSILNSSFIVSQFQFTSAPEPSTGMLAVISLPTLLGFRRIRCT